MRPGLLAVEPADDTRRGKLLSTRRHGAEAVEAERHSRIDFSHDHVVGVGGQLAPKPTPVLQMLMRRRGRDLQLCSDRLLPWIVLLPIRGK